MKELDFKTIISHWEKIQQDIVTIDVIHDAMNKLTEEEGETEEADYAIHSAKMIGTSNSLAKLAEAARLYGRCKAIRLSLNRYSSLPKLDGCNVEPALSDLKYKLDEMQKSQL